MNLLPVPPDDVRPECLVSGFNQTRKLSKAYGEFSFLCVLRFREELFPPFSDRSFPIAICSKFSSVIPISNFRNHRVSVYRSFLFRRFFLFPFPPSRRGMQIFIFFFSKQTDKTSITCSNSIMKKRVKFDSTDLRFFFLFLLCV